MAENNIKTSIDITVFDKNGVETNEKRTVKIRPMRAFQFISLSKLISQTIKELDASDNLTSVIAEFVGANSKATDREDLLRLAGEKFYKNAGQSIALLLDILPDKAMTIISTLAQIDLVQLSLQETDVLFDVIDAVVEVNDFQKVLDRVKKSMKLFTSKVTFNQVANQATASTVAPIR